MILKKSILAICLIANSYSLTAQYDSKKFTEMILLENNIYIFLR